MHYWLHRCSKHACGLLKLKTERILTIGFSDCARNSQLVEAIQNGNWDEFCKRYKDIYGNDLWRARHFLWHFAHNMCEGDVVVVPLDGAFSICRLVAGPRISPMATEGKEDIGWEWDVEPLANSIGPRDCYASAQLLSRMKARQTTLLIDDLASDVNDALDRILKGQPFSLPDELAVACRKILFAKGGPDRFERLICDHFRRLGADDAYIPSKNARDKEGDCDIIANFSALRLTVFVQAKFHGGTEDDFAVRQIKDWTESKTLATETEDPNWTYVSWVISFADEFSEKAKALAKENSVVLINGDEFCKMLTQDIARA